MANHPHNSKGRKCSACGKEFERTSLTLRIYTTDGNCRVSNIVCRDCYNKHYEQGE